MALEPLVQQPLHLKQELAALELRHQLLDHQLLTQAVVALGVLTVVQQAIGRLGQVVLAVVAQVLLQLMEQQAQQIQAVEVVVDMLALALETAGQAAQA